jgi:hypothetical protein
MAILPILTIPHRLIGLPFLGITSLLPLENLDELAGRIIDRQTPSPVFLVLKDGDPFAGRAKKSTARSMDLLKLGERWDVIGC